MRNKVTDDGKDCQGANVVKASFWVMSSRPIRGQEKLAPGIVGRQMRMEGLNFYYFEDFESRTWGSGLQRCRSHDLYSRK